MENHEEATGSTPSIRAAIYLRSADPDEGAINRQEEGCQRYLAQRNYTHTASTKDIGCSGIGRKARPGLARILEMCEAGTIEILICSRLDRLSRDPVELLELVTCLKRTGIGLETVEEGDVFAQPEILHRLEFLAQYFQHSAAIYLRTSQGPKRRNRRKKPERPATHVNPPLFED
jgi:DNA invertase Pin-like site-specific DNA recombinase